MTERLQNNLIVRFAVVGFLVLIMLVPLALVSGLSSERQGYFQQTLHEIAASWGNQQKIVGPVLVVPAMRKVRDDRIQDGRVVETRWRESPMNVIVLPDRLDMDVKLEHQFRHRAIYDVPVFQAEVNLLGSFPTLDLDKLDPQPDRLLLDEAKLVIGLGDIHAVGHISQLRLGDVRLEVEPGSHHTFVAEKGVHVPLATYTGEATEEFSLSLELKGTDGFHFAPIGAATTVSMQSSWPHPSFSGAFLPDRYEISADGFDAQWSVHAFARGMPDAWSASDKPLTIAQHLGGVRLHNPVTPYTLVDRGIKYGVLFVALTYLVFVCFELMAGCGFHLVQYGVVGLGLALFYLTLLSLSEHIRFGIAYTLASLIMTALIAWYVGAITGETRLAGIIAAVEMGLYGILYVLLQLEDYALLTGTAVLLLAFGLIMYATRALGGGQKAVGATA